MIYDRELRKQGIELNDGCNHRTGGGDKMKINCDLCKRELKKQGALIFSHPQETGMVKWHICGDCYYGKLQNSQGK